MRRDKEIACEFDGQTYWFEKAALPKPQPKALDLAIEQQIFRAIHDGTSLREIVLRHKVSTASAEKIFAAWLRMGSSIVITEFHLQELENMRGLRGIFPIRNGDELLRMIRKSIEPRPCAQCAKSPAVVCVACAESLAL